MQQLLLAEQGRGDLCIAEVPVGGTGGEVLIFQNVVVFFNNIPPLTCSTPH
jgi:hypothetical protein